MSAVCAPIPRLTREAVNTAVRLGLEGLRAQPVQPLSEWAQQHFVLAGESSQQKGGWEAWAFQVGLMDFFSDDRIEELGVKKSKRVGYTKIVAAFIAYNIYRHRNVAVWQPTDDDRDSFVKSEIDPLLDERDGVHAVLKMRSHAGGVEDTIKYKSFRHSVVHLLGGKAKRAYRRITVAVAILDEMSAFDQQIEKSGDPAGLAKGRLEGAAYPKFVGGSTPGVKGLCHVERLCENADGYVRFNIECPRCGVEHPLSWGGKDKAFGFKWTRHHPETVHHVCPHCRESITQADYLPGGKPLAGVWVCEKTGKRYGADRVWRDERGQPCRPPVTLGLHVWAAYSPQRSWPSIVKEFEEALVTSERGDTGPMRLFVNETLGETWEEKGEASDEHALQARAKAEPVPFNIGTVPIGALVLTAGVDLQGDRWEIGVWGWARGLESWSVDHHVIQGNPSDERDWEAVEVYLRRRYTQAWHGGSMGIESISMDSGHHTQAVYDFVRRMQARSMRIHAIKGSSEENKPIKGIASPQDVTWRGRTYPKGVKVWLMGTDTAKDLLHGQLGITNPGPGCVHFAQDLPKEWFEQLTAEQRIPVKTPSGTAERWVKRRPRNEVLDCRNYALHSAYALGLHTWTDKRWTQQEAAVQPPRDLFSAPDVLPQLAPVPAPVAAQVEAAAATPEKPGVWHNYNRPRFMR